IAVTICPTAVKTNPPIMPISARPIPCIPTHSDSPIYPSYHKRVRPDPVSACGSFLAPTKSFGHLSLRLSPHELPCGMLDQHAHHAKFGRSARLKTGFWVRSFLQWKPQSALQAVRDVSF